MERELGAAGLPHARQEARDILGVVMGEGRFWAVLHEDQSPSETVVARAWGAVRRRVLGAPFAYAVGEAAFRHLVLAVDERVLIPRQETELLVEVVLEATEGGTGTAVDVGTGSGAIALALASEGRFGRVIATDVSVGALAVAAENVARLAGVLRCPVELRHGSLLAPLRGERVRAVVSNPPYISAAEMREVPRSVRDWEPAVALVSGADGLSATRRLVREAATILEPGGALVLEVDARRARQTAELALAEGHYGDVSVRPDLTGRDRILLARRNDS